MPQLNGVIPQQGFERVKYRICEILADEFPRQYELNYNDEDINISECWSERFWAFDNSELPALNVVFLDGDLTGHHLGSTDHTIRVAVECYTYAADRDTDSGAVKDDTGDALAKAKCQRIMGLVRAIIENPVYKQLGFEPNFIFSVHCTRMEMMRMDGEDARNTAIGRVIVEIKLHESADLIEPNLINGYKTTVFMEETSKGYLFITY